MLPTNSLYLILSLLWQLNLFLINRLECSIYYILVPAFISRLIKCYIYLMIFSWFYGA